MKAGVSAPLGQRVRTSTDAARAAAHALARRATEWLNSEPFGPAELRGHVVLGNLWTLTRINSLRQEPYVRAWSQAYRDDGLVVIGRELSFKPEIGRVRQAMKERAIDDPVALDNDYEIWSVIQRLLGVEPELVSLEGSACRRRPTGTTCPRAGAGDQVPRSSCRGVRVHVRIASCCMDELVVVEVVGTEPEAGLVCSRLRSAGIRCLPRLTNRGAGAGDGLSTAGPHEIMVRAEDAQSAREILRKP